MDSNNGFQKIFVLWIPTNRPFYLKLSDCQRWEGNLQFYIAKVLSLIIDRERPKTRASASPFLRKKIYKQSVVRASLKCAVAKEEDCRGIPETVAEARS